MKKLYFSLSALLGNGKMSKQFFPAVLLTAIIPLILVLFFATAVQVASGSPSGISIAGVTGTVGTPTCSI